MKSKNQKSIKNQKGMAAILAVVILCAVSLLMSRNTLILGLSGLDIAYNYAQGESVLNFTEGCVEETIRQFQLNENYSATDKNFSLGDFYCIINTSSSSGEQIITVDGNSGDYYKSIKAEILLNEGSASINNWQEI
ncbi:MAG: hypothetical protein U9M94_02665 [Patescibacteria group bacterium]|nr:hypothetical protein [Patescibacteria group bacterium]